MRLDAIRVLISNEATELSCAPWYQDAQLGAIPCSASSAALGGLNARSRCHPWERKGWACRSGLTLGGMRPTTMSRALT